MNEILLYGSVGADFWGEDCFTAMDVHSQLANMDGDVTVRLNSGGGIAHEGQAIYNHLKDYDGGDVHIVVDGAAVSAASLIAMAGDTITMRAGAFMMIHDPAQWMIEGRGTEDDHLRAAAGLAVLAKGYAKVYASRAGISADDARAIMKTETWYDGETAVEAGFATAADDEQAAAAAMFDYSIYASAPQELAGSTVPKETRKTKQAVMAMMAKPAATSPKGNQMAKKLKAAKAAAQKAATAAVMAGDADVIAAATAAAAAAGGSADDDEIAAIAAEAAEEATAAADDDDASMADDDDDATMADDDDDASMADDDDDDDAAADDPVAVQILDLGAALNRPEAEATELIRKGATVSQAVAHWNGLKRKENPMTGKTMRGAQARSTQPTEAREKFRAGAQLALMAKVGLDGGERNEFASMSLQEMARHAVMMSGHDGVFADRRDLIGHAFTMDGAHTTSDFAQILSNVMGKAALVGYDEAEETFHLFTRKGNLPNFQPSKRVGLGVFDDLPKVDEGANYQFGTFGDRGENIVLATYGKMLRISRQSIINDDLSILGEAPRRMGRAAKRTIGNLVIGVLTGNAAMADGQPIFSAAADNLITGATSAMGVASLTKMEEQMMTQSADKAEDGDEQPAALNIMPAHLLVPAALKRSTEVLMASQYDPRDSKGHAPNPVANMADVISDARLDRASKTAFYMLASPSATDTIEVAYLDGNDAPYIEEQTAWHADGVEMKVRIDAGVSPLDRKTMQKSNGA